MKSFENDVLNILSESEIEFVRREDDKKLWQETLIFLNINQLNIFLQESIC